MLVTKHIFCMKKTLKHFSKYVLCFAEERKSCELCEVFNGTFFFRLSKLQAVLQMDFEVEDVSSQSEIQVIKWELTLPDEVKMMGASEGTMRIYTTQRDFVGLAPLVMVGYGTSLKIVKIKKVKSLYLRQ